MHKNTTQPAPTHPHTHTQANSIATELEDQMGEGVINANMGTTYEMLCNLEQALEHHEKVSEIAGGGEN